MEQGHANIAPVRGFQADTLSGNHTGTKALGMGTRNPFGQPGGSGCIDYNQWTEQINIGFLFSSIQNRCSGKCIGNISEKASPPAAVESPT